MAVPTVMSDLSTTAASNSPAGSESPTAGDDFLRSIQAIVRTTNAKGADIASATSTAIGAATGEFVDVTGTTTITSFDTIAAGIVRTVRFTGALTLTHNATSLILPGSANITTVNGDVAQFRSLGSGNWKCTGYLPQTGSPATAPFLDSTAIVKGSSDATKLLAFEVDTNQTTGVTRTVTTQNVSGTMGLVEDQLGAINAVPGSNAMVITINPCVIPVRSATLGSGTVNVRAINTAITTTISSGSTGGTVSGVPSRIAVLAIDNAGTMEAAWCNASGSVLLDESTLISTTAEGGAGAADSANVIYSTTARSNVPFKIRGYFDSTQATAGTWVTAPSTIQGWGGQSSAAKASQIISGALTATTSGTSIDFTGIPLWVKRITIMFSGVSTNGTSNYQVQIGDAGGIETSGYLASSSVILNAANPVTTSYTTGFGITTGSASVVIHGKMELCLMDYATASWVCSYSMGRSDGGFTMGGGGSKSLSPGPLDRIRLTTVNGTDAFDAGSINILYE